MGFGSFREKEREQKNQDKASQRRAEFRGPGLPFPAPPKQHTKKEQNWKVNGVEAEREVGEYLGETGVNLWKRALGMEKCVSDGAEREADEEIRGRGLGDKDYSKNAGERQRR